MSAGRADRLLPAVAGVWYPDDPGALREQVRGLLRAHTRRGDASPTAVIAPHAGFAYSGKVAAAAFSRVAGSRPARVVLIGPSHYEAFDGAVVPRATSYATPLGDVRFDQEAVAELAKQAGVVATDRPFLPEHSLEAEIPFLQEALTGDWRLVPILIGSGASPDSVQQVADALSRILTGDSLIVVSSDFTHYGERFGYVPFSAEIPERIRQLDLGAVNHILERDGEGFRRYVARTGATICGKHAIDVLLRVLPGSGTADLGAYDMSGNMTGSWDFSVSYAGLAFGPPGPLGGTVAKPPGETTGD